MRRGEPNEPPLSGPYGEEKREVQPREVPRCDSREEEKHDEGEDVPDGEDGQVGKKQQAKWLRILVQREYALGHKGVSDWEAIRT